MASVEVTSTLHPVIAPALATTTSAVNAPCVGHPKSQQPSTQALTNSQTPDSFCKKNAMALAWEGREISSNKISKANTLTKAEQGEDEHSMVPYFHTRHQLMSSFSILLNTVHCLLTIQSSDHTSGCTIFLHYGT